MTKMLDDAGALAMVENPRKSLLWKMAEVKELKCAGFNVHNYEACVYFAARNKAQSLLANFEEARKLETGECRHLHSSNAWEPEFRDGKWWYPSEQEAEYTPALAFSMAVSLSMAACRLGRAQLKIPRMPKVSAWGSRLGWELYNPDVLRSWLMPAQARAIGLDPPECAPGDWFPMAYTAVCFPKRRFKE